MSDSNIVLAQIIHNDSLRFCNNLVDSKSSCFSSAKIRRLLKKCKNSAENLHHSTKKHIFAATKHVKDFNAEE